MASSDRITTGVSGEGLFCPTSPAEIAPQESTFPWQDGSSNVEMPPTPRQPTARPTEGEALRTYIGENEPPYCECARLAKRPLSWAFWSELFSDNRTLGSQDLEFSHSHIIFDQSRDNIGFGPHGLFAEDVDSMDYHYEPECYDGGKVRKAVREQDPPSFYRFIYSNCQAYAKSVLRAFGL